MYMQQLVVPLVVLMKLYLPKNRHLRAVLYAFNFGKPMDGIMKQGVIRNHKLSKDKVYNIKPFTKEVVFDAFRLISHM